MELTEFYSCLPTTAFGDSVSHVAKAGLPYYYVASAVPEPPAFNLPDAGITGMRHNQSALGFLSFYSR